MAYNFAAGNKRLSGNLKGYNEEKAKEHSAKSKALGKKRLHVKDESGEYKLHKLTHTQKNRVVFTGKGGFAKNFSKIQAAQKRMDYADQP